MAQIKFNFGITNWVQCVFPIIKRECVNVFSTVKCDFFFLFFFFSIRFVSNHNTSQQEKRQVWAGMAVSERHTHARTPT